MLIGLSANSQLRWFQIDQIEKFVNVRRLYSKIKKCLRFVDYKRDRKKLMIEMYFSSKLTNISVVDEDFPVRSTIPITLSCRYCWQDLTPISKHAPYFYHTNVKTQKNEFRIFILELFGRI